jgi:HEAT repeat protein
MPASEELKSLVAQMPDPDERGMYTTIDKEKVEAAIAELHKGGRESVLGLIEMLVPPGEGDDAKPHYALHCLALHVRKLEDERGRREFAEAVASQLGGDRPKAVQAYLCQELQVAGGKEVVEALGKLLADEELCDPAARALVAIGSGAGDLSRAALRKATGKRRLILVQSLGVVRDRRAVDALREALGDQDREVRIAAAWSLGNIGDAGSADLLLKASDAEPGWERIQATKACLLLAEKLLAAGKKDDAASIYTHLRDTRTDPSERYVRDVAERALAAAR